ncbi:TPA: hypothetical protein ACH3X3_003796 [Trebouxia sp. C0006]
MFGEIASLSDQLRNQAAGDWGHPLELTQKFQTLRCLGPIAQRQVETLLKWTGTGVSLFADTGPLSHSNWFLTLRLIHCLCKALQQLSKLSSINTVRCRSRAVLC